MRHYDTGATRDDADDKYDYEGFLSPLVIERYAEYMHKHRKQADGEMRDSDNWQSGIPKDDYMKSGWRHFMDWWKEHRGLSSREGLEDALCALLFNVSGYLHEVLKEDTTTKVLLTWDITDDDVVGIVVEDRIAPYVSERHESCYECVDAHSMMNPTCRSCMTHAAENGGHRNEWRAK